jgi:beta-galactosidase
VITRPYGKGRITYIGAVLNDKWMTAATQSMVQKSGVVPALGPVPNGIEVCRREGARGNVSIVIDFFRNRSMWRSLACDESAAGRQ